MEVPRGPASYNLGKVAWKWMQHTGKPSGGEERETERQRRRDWDKGKERLENQREREVKREGEKEREGGEREKKREREKSKDLFQENPVYSYPSDWLYPKSSPLYLKRKNLFWSIRGEGLIVEGSPTLPAGASEPQHWSSWDSWRFCCFVSFCFSVNSELLELEDWMSFPSESSLI